jgi:dihydroorotate dehydrogenase
MAALLPAEHWSPARAILRAIFRADRPELPTRIMGLEFDNPIGLAAGFDKNGRRARALAALGFGHLELGTVTARAQEPNPPPNLFRLPRDGALVNRLGFPNEGAALLRERIGKHTAEVGSPIGISIGKSRTAPISPIEAAIDDYRESFRVVRDVAHFVVVNVSSPNTKDLRAIQGAELARALLGALVKENEAKVPLLVKIAPDLSDADLEALLAVVDECRLDGVVATNTTIARDHLVTGAAEIERIGAGGLSGAPLRLRSREMVRRVRARLGADKTVIGVGGIASSEDALEMMKAGANLVQLYTGFIYGGPGIVKTIALGLADAARREGAVSVAELTRAAWPTGG